MMSPNKEHSAGGAKTLPQQCHFKAPVQASCACYNYFLHASSQTQKQGLKLTSSSCDQPQNRQQRIKVTLAIFFSGLRQNKTLRKTGICLKSRSKTNLKKKVWLLVAAFHKTSPLLHRTNVLFHYTHESSLWSYSFPPTLQLHICFIHIICPFSALSQPCLSNYFPILLHMKILTLPALPLPPSVFLSVPL